MIDNPFINVLLKDCEQTNDIIMPVAKYALVLTNFSINSFRTLCYDQKICKSELMNISIVQLPKMLMSSINHENQLNRIVKLEKTILQQINKQQLFDFDNYEYVVLLWDIEHDNIKQYLKTNFTSQLTDLINAFKIDLALHKQLNIRNTNNYINIIRNLDIDNEQKCQQINSTHLTCFIELITYAQKCNNIYLLYFLTNVGFCVFSRLDFLKSIGHILTHELYQFMPIFVVTLAIFMHNCKKNKQNNFIKSEVATKLPSFPYIQQNIKLSPYAHANIGIDSNTNLMSTFDPKQDNQKILFSFGYPINDNCEYKLVNMCEFKKQLNVFMNKYENRNIKTINAIEQFDWKKHNLYFVGDCVSASSSDNTHLLNGSKNGQTEMELYELFNDLYNDAQTELYCETTDLIEFAKNINNLTLKLQFKNNCMISVNKCLNIRINKSHFDAIIQFLNDCNYCSISQMTNCKLANIQNNQNNQNNHNNHYNQYICQTEKQYNDAIVKHFCNDIVNNKIVLNIEDNTLTIVDEQSTQTIINVNISKEILLLIDNFINKISQSYLLLAIDNSKYHKFSNKSTLFSLLHLIDTTNCSFDVDVADINIENKDTNEDTNKEIKIIPNLFVNIDSIKLRTFRIKWTMGNVQNEIIQNAIASCDAGYFDGKKCYYDANFICSQMSKTIRFNEAISPYQHNKLVSLINKYRSRGYTIILSDHEYEYVFLNSKHILCDNYQRIYNDDNTYLTNSQILSFYDKYCDYVSSTYVIDSIRKKNRNTMQIVETLFNIVV